MNAYDVIFSHGIFGQVSLANCVIWSEGIAPTLSCILSTNSDGMLAIASGNEVKVLTPTYSLDVNYYSGRWLRIANITPATTEAPPVFIFFCVSITHAIIQLQVDSNHSLIFALRETSSKISIRTFLWSPPAITFTLPSVLTLLLTDGTLLLTTVYAS